VAVALLAFELEGARGVIDPEHEPLRLSGLCVLGQLELERDVATVVGAELLAVEPGGGAPVGCADHEEHPAPGPRRWHDDRPGIPGDDRAGGPAPGKGHEDLAWLR